MIDLNGLLQLMAAMSTHDVGEVIITHDRVELRRQPARGGADTGPGPEANAAALPGSSVTAPAVIPPSGAAAGTGGSGELFTIKAPLPGVVHCHPAKGPKGINLPGVGERLPARSVALVVEAMKMNNEVLTPRAGIIRSLKVQHGQKAKAGQVLMELEAVLE